MKPLSWPFLELFVQLVQTRIDEAVAQTQLLRYRFAHGFFYINRLVTPKTFLTFSARTNYPLFAIEKKHRVHAPIGYVTRDEYEVQFSDIFDQIVAYAAATPINVVNPQVLKSLKL